MTAEKRELALLYVERLARQCKGCIRRDTLACRSCPCLEAHRIVEGDEFEIRGTSAPAELGRSRCNGKSQGGSYVGVPPRVVERRGKIMARLQEQLLKGFRCVAMADLLVGAKRPGTLSDDLDAMQRRGQIEVVKVAGSKCVFAVAKEVIES